MGWKKKNKRLKKPNTWYGRLWYFIWHDDSLASWVVNVILAYLLIKFIVYPGFGLVLGTNYPIVAVVSNSMEHHQGFEQWWTENEDYYLGQNITEYEFQKYPFKNGFNKGDIMFLTGKNPEDIEIGEVIVFQSGKPYPIIHRVIHKEDKAMWVFQTKGDNNEQQIRDEDLDEKRVLETQLLGRASFRVPLLGYVKIWFVEIMDLLGLYNA